jgi:hypothetical protein
MKGDPGSRRAIGEVQLGGAIGGGTRCLLFLWMTCFSSLGVGPKTQSSSS